MKDEMVEIVIKIPKDIYESLDDQFDEMWKHYLVPCAYAIRNGIVLPKGHGKLVDADKAVNDYTNYGISHMWDATDLPYIMNECSAVIEADKEVEV